MHREHTEHTEHTEHSTYEASTICQYLHGPFNVIKCIPVPLKRMKNIHFHTQMAEWLHSQHLQSNFRESIKPISKSLFENNAERVVYIYISIYVYMYAGESVIVKNVPNKINIHLSTFTRYPIILISFSFMPIFSNVHAICIQGPTKEYASLCLSFC